MVFIGQTKPRSGNFMQGLFGEIPRPLFAAAFSHPQALVWNGRQSLEPSQDAHQRGTHGSRGVPVVSRGCLAVWPVAFKLQHTGLTRVNWVPTVRQRLSP
jgi:hypothetical protein